MKKKSALCIGLLLCILSVSAAEKRKTSYVYQIDLSGNLFDFWSKPKSFGFSISFGNKKNTLGLNDILRNINYAKTSDKISGIVLTNGSLSGGLASFREFREALIDFKKSGKFIYAYSDNYSQSNYYLASVANKLMLNSYGSIDVKGLSAQTTFYKNALDKLGIEMQVVKVGSYKSAVEPYTSTSMSEKNKEQVSSYLFSVWNVLLDEISAARNIATADLNTFANEFTALKTADELKTLQLVDTLVYSNEADTIISKIGAGSINYKRLNHDIVSKKSRKQARNKNQIAVIYLSGNIGSGKNEINAKSVLSVYQSIKNNNSIKAVVLRVNSPGGSAFESEKIHHILTLLKSRKPVVVSMGNYAASGGYYISCFANKIIAQPTTITGSIGIFGMIPNASKLYEKAGITTDAVNTNAMSDSYSAKRAMTEAENEKLQRYINSGYELFVKRCAEGRKISVDSINSLAQGRVWTGTDALKIGLIDKLGGLNTAITEAAKLARIDSYSTITINPKASRPTQSFASVIQKNIDESFGNNKYANLIKLIYDLGEQNQVDRIQALLTELPDID